MPKNIQNKIRILIKKILLRRKGVVIENNCTFTRINFTGRAKIEPYCRLIGDPEIIIGDNFYMNAGCHILGEIRIGNDVFRFHKGQRSHLCKWNTHFRPCRI